MKTRQSKLLCNINNSKTSKPVLTKTVSYECIRENCNLESEDIPKLIIRKKKRPYSEINNETQISNKVKVELPKLSNDIIADHIVRCSKFSKFIDCKSFFDNFISKINFNDKVCWNKLYSPKTADNFLSSNFKNVLKFKNWLEKWNQVKKSKKKIYFDDSDFENDEFMNMKSKSELLPTICIIYGNRGVGKSSLVHAIASEINFKVFEINCSSKRTGKDVLDELENAAINKLVKIDKTVETSSKLLKNNTKNFFEPISKKPKLEETLIRQNSSCTLQNQSLFLFDDVDVVMEEDRGLFRAICALVEKRTRPVILTVSDPIELKNIILQLGKHSYKLLNIEQSPITDIAVYLQLILLSRGLVVQHGDMLQWIFSSCSILDLRSCLNNLQFSFINRHLDFKPKPEFFRWDYYKLKNLCNTSPLLDKKTKSDSSIIDKNSKSICKRSIHNLSSQLNILRHIDSQIPTSKRFRNRVDQRNSTIDLHCLEEHDNNNGLFSDIQETLIMLYNRTLHKSMTKFETDALLTSPTSEFNKVQRPKSFPNKKVIEIQSSITSSINVRSAVSGVSDRMDRLNSLKIMATLENNRKSNFTPRRFTHYFDRIHLRVKDIDLKYSVTPFKNNQK